MRLLYVTPSDIDDVPRGGRAMLARLHRDSLRDLLKDEFSEHRLQAVPITSLRKMTGYLDGLTPASIAVVVEALDDRRADAVWLDGSNLGRLAQAVKRLRPEIRVVTFCHNVEAQFFLGALRRFKKVHSLGVLAGNYVAERLATRFSNTVVTLSERDSKVLERLYGRGGDAVIPMALEDHGGDASIAEAQVAPDAPVLFVGGSFYANRAGISWYSQFVAPRLDRVSTLVVGKGLEAMKSELERSAGVSVVGEVDQLEPLYRAARVVIAPIFDGSGMKTKVAEALMFGKKVIGTPEAFSGYAEDVVRENWLCRTADDFVTAIGVAHAEPLKSFDPALRRFYERDHSPEALRRHMQAVLGKASGLQS